MTFCKVSWPGNPPRNPPVISIKSPQLIEDYRERIKQKVGANNLNEVIQIMMTKGCSGVERKRAMG